MESLVKIAAKQNDSLLKEALKSEKAEARFGAAYVAGERRLAVVQELIELLTDSDLYVRLAARRSLIMLSYFAEENRIASESAAKGSKATTLKPKAVDFGPAPEAKPKVQKEAAKKWSAWWAKHESDLPKQKTETKSAKAK